MERVVNKEKTKTKKKYIKEIKKNFHGNEVWAARVFRF
jgi:replication initiation and membrane attachment protein DnaB